MKQLLPILLLATLLTACQFNTSNKHKISENRVDTITTASGLKYWFLKHGNGPKVLPGAKVATYLNLKINDSTVWNSFELKDSVFTFVAENTPLIEGFNEVMRFLREGDEIVAILPYTIAYGENGSGESIPPYATLVYNQFKVVHVGEPKLSMADSLFLRIKKHGTQKLATFHRQIVKDSANYLTDADQWKKLWSLLNKEKMHNQALAMLDYCKNSSSRFRYYKVNSLYAKGEVDNAIRELENLIQEDSVYAKYPKALKLLEEMKAGKQ